MKNRVGQSRRIGWARTSAAVVAMAAVAVGCTGTEEVQDPGPPDPVDLGDVRLVAFDSCDGLLDWFHTEAEARVGPFGLGGPGDEVLLEQAGGSRAGGETSSAADSAASAPSPTANDGGSSTTNTQEPGIGEPDLTWTDGTRVVTVVNGSLQVVDLAAGEVTATITLDEGDDVASAGAAPIGLLVEGDHAVVIQQGWTRSGDVGMTNGTFVDRIEPAGTSRTLLTRVDIGSVPEVVGEVAVDGGYVDARMVDGVVRAVVRSSPAELGWVYPSGSSAASQRRAEEANRAIVAESTIDDWLPGMTVTTGSTTSERSSAVDCGAVEHPADFGGFDVVTVVGLDLAAGAVEPLPSAAVVAGAGTVYASADHLYVTTTRYPEMEANGPDDTAVDRGDDEPAIRTDVHAFGLPSDETARYEASGSVPGQLLNQFALSQHDGDLRVATTTVPMWGGPTPAAEDGQGTGSSPSIPAVSESRVTVLRGDGDTLATVGEVTGLGPTEQIQGVRFAGPLAYVVTFRQTDPLYVVDLSDPTAPRTAGELKIPGFSSYLQDLGDGRVLGLGQDATETGRVTGFQESLFDVGDPARPSRLANLVVRDSASMAEQDHHAVLWWAPDRLLAVPVSGWFGPTDDQSAPTNRVLVTRVTDGAIEEVGSITHPLTTSGGSSSPCPPNARCAMPIEPGPGGGGWSPLIVRTLVADGRLVTVSAEGVKVSDLATLADVSWIPLS